MIEGIHHLSAVMRGLDPRMRDCTSLPAAKTWMVETIRGSGPRTAVTMWRGCALASRGRDS